MTDLPPLHLLRHGEERAFHGTWYRGDHTNFIPSKNDLNQPGAIDDYVVQGWSPAAPFIDRDLPITAFGSCFACEISRRLIDAGYNVFGRHLNLQSHIVRFGEGIVNSFAVKQQLEWGLGFRDFPEYLWIGPNKEIAGVDPEIRRETAEIIRHTKVFIITLGLSEIWYDKTSNEAFWRAIPSDMFDQERHGFRLSTVEENFENLKAIVDLIRGLRNGARIVFTLSPIPLMATFRPISCLTANSVSKAILRVAIDQLMAERGGSDVYYFPSYEIVKEFAIDPFIEDNRHPKSEVIQSVMESFMRHYCKEPADNPL